MKQQQFEQLHRPQWEQMERYLVQLSKPKSMLNGYSLENFPHLYRQVCQHLAIARERQYTPLLVEHLNQLVLKGHQYLYTYPDVPFERVRMFLNHGFPEAVRTHTHWVGLSILLFFGSFLISATLAYLYDESVNYLFTPQELRALEAMYDPHAARLGYPVNNAADNFYMFGYYLQHNTSIGFQTFATGILFGLGSIFYLLFNGIYLGSITGYLLHKGYSEPFLSFVSGHSAFELTAIVLSGVAGLKLGFALLAPQRHARYVALQSTAREVIPLIYGFALLFILAAFIEAFWSSDALLDIDLKYVIGMMSWICLWLYFAFVGRNNAN
jgi:uncharacterized membrane protein SpoIIM required for sporulation